MKIFLPAALAALLSLLASAAPAANVYRCPDGSYADKPCGQGQKVVTTTRRSSSSSDEARSCTALGEDAERLARKKAAGVTASQALAGVDNEYIPFEEKAARKKFVVQVFRAQGSPAEVRSLVEADCVAEKRAVAEKTAAERAAAERAAAAEKSAAARTPPATVAAGGATAGMSKEQCDRMKKDIAAMQRQQAEAAAILGEEGGKPDKSNQPDLSKQFAGVCPN